MRRTLATLALTALVPLAARAEEDQPPAPEPAPETCGGGLVEPGHFEGAAILWALERSGDATVEAVANREITFSDTVTGYEVLVYVTREGAQIVIRLAVGRCGAIEIIDPS